MSEIVVPAEAAQYLEVVQALLYLVGVAGLCLSAVAVAWLLKVLFSGGHS